HVGRRASVAPYFEFIQSWLEVLGRGQDFHSHKASGNRRKHFFVLSQIHGRPISLHDLLSAPLDDWLPQRFECHHSFLHSLQLLKNRTLQSLVLFFLVASSKLPFSM